MSRARIPASVVAAMLLCGPLAACTSSDREAAVPSASTGSSSISTSASATTSVPSPTQAAPSESRLGTGLQPNLGEVSAYAFSAPLTDQEPVAGQTLESSRNQVLSFLVNCAQGCTNTTFNLPRADGPLSALGGTSSAPGAVSWRIVTRGEWSPGYPLEVYPGQVYFTAGQNLFFKNQLAESGLTPLPLGAQLGSGIAAYRVPGTWNDASQFAVIGELALFDKKASLPRGFTFADGHTVAADSALGTLLSWSGYPVKNSKVAVPSLSPVEGNRWAIAEVGAWPIFR